jgi:hypothetical protein
VADDALDATFRGRPSGGNQNLHEPGDLVHGFSGITTPRSASTAYPLSLAL